MSRKIWKKMNIPAILGVFKVLRSPSILLPQYTVQTFDQLPVPLSDAFAKYQRGDKHVEIRAVVLDKDNCFAKPKTDVVYSEYSDKFKSLLQAYSPDNILIVSNSSGTLSQDPDGSAADRLERNTGVKVLRHTVRKPGCGNEIIEYFGDRISSPSQIAVIGDRLFTDVVMANRMGAYAIWIKRGTVQDSGLVTRLEYGLSSFLAARGFRAPMP